MELAQPEAEFEDVAVGVPELVPVKENMPVELPDSVEESVTPVLPDDVIETVPDKVLRVEAVGVTVKKADSDCSLVSDGESVAERDMTAVNDICGEAL